MKEVLEIIILSNIAIFLFFTLLYWILFLYSWSLDVIDDIKKRKELKDE